MKEDIQKPILYKADPYVFAQLEKMKEAAAPWRFNRNKFLNEAVTLYIELVRLIKKPEYGFINVVSFNDAHLQRILFERLRSIARRYR